MEKLKELKELKETIENIKITYDYEETYTNLLNATIDYQNNTQDWRFEEIFQDIIDYEIAEERAKYELEQGGLIRLCYFLGDANLNNQIFRIDGYGNLTDITKDDLQNVKDEILEEIKNAIQEESEAQENE